LTTPVSARRGRPIADATIDGEASGLGDLADAVPHLVWVADDSGQVTAYNRRIADYGDVRDTGDPGLRWELLVHPDDLAATTRAWTQALRWNARLNDPRQPHLHPYGRAGVMTIPVELLLGAPTHPAP